MIDYSMIICLILCLALIPIIILFRYKISKLEKDINLQESRISNLTKALIIKQIEEKNEKVNKKTQLQKKQVQKKQEEIENSDIENSDIDDDNTEQDEFI